MSLTVCGDGGRPGDLGRMCWRSALLSRLDVSRGQGKQRSDHIRGGDTSPTPRCLVRRKNYSRPDQPSRRTGAGREPNRPLRPVPVAGVEKVRAEWAMICTAHNLLKLFTLAKAA